MGEPPLDERDVRLGEVASKGDRFEYVYDFGHDWRHEIVVEKEAAAGPRAPKAECLERDVGDSG